MKTEQEMNAIISRLKTLYPDAMCSLDYDKEYELLFSVRLAAQCTDARVNLVTPALFARFPRLEDYAVATPEEVGEYIRSCGFWRAKARDIVACAQQLLARQMRGHEDLQALQTGAALALMHPAAAHTGKKRSGQLQCAAAAAGLERACDLRRSRTVVRLQRAGGFAQLRVKQQCLACGKRVAPRVLRLLRGLPQAVKPRISAADADGIPM